jgi:hypothetical protein
VNALKGVALAVGDIAGDVVAATVVDVAGARVALTGGALLEVAGMLEAASAVEADRI